MKTHLCESSEKRARFFISFLKEVVVGKRGEESLRLLATFARTGLPKNVFVDPGRSQLPSMQPWRLAATSRD